MSLAFQDINHSYGAQSVLTDVSLTAAAGEILCLLGPSGSGKTTLLRLAAGLETLQSGSITLGDRVLAKGSVQLPPEQRSVGLVFQDHVLYPHLTVAQNVAFGLSDRTADVQAQVVGEQLAAVDLEGYGARFPHTLSGGQQQRVALARALAPQPSVMLLDEPFASVDSGLRRQLREQARLALKAREVVTVVVTHDAEEALELGDQIAYLVNGQVAQCDTPEAIWRAPASAAVALAFGDAQRLQATVSNGLVRTDFGDLAADGFTDQRQASPSPNAVIVLRPQAIAVAPVAVQADAEVLDQRFAGQGVAVLLRSTRSPAAKPLRAMIAASDIDRQLTPGTPVQLRFSSAQTFVFDAD